MKRKMGMVVHTTPTSEVEARRIVNLRPTLVKVAVRPCVKNKKGKVIKQEEKSRRLEGTEVQGLKLYTKFVHNYTQPPECETVSTHLLYMYV
jgi:hypothetical protein